MGKNRRRDKEVEKTLRAVAETSRTIAQSAEHTNEKLDEIKEDTVVMRKSSTSKIPVYSLIVAIIGVVVTIIIGVAGRVNPQSEAGSEAEAAVEAPEYEMYLYSDYSTVREGAEVDMTATLNFEADEVAITANLASGGEDTLLLDRKNASEWQKKVVFDETGVHEIVASAKTPDGKVIENSIKVEVMPVSIDMGSTGQLFNAVFNSMAEEFQAELN